jgi:hypothetical protein
VLDASAVSVFVIDCTTTGYLDPTGTPLMKAVADSLREIIGKLWLACERLES